MKYALIAAIEGDRKNLNNDMNIVQFERLYESEAVICFQNWRKNGGWLKDNFYFRFFKYTLCW